MNVARFGIDRVMIVRRGVHRLITAPGRVGICFVTEFMVDPGIVDVRIVDLDLDLGIVDVDGVDVVRSGVGGSGTVRGVVVGVGGSGRGGGVVVAGFAG